MTSIATTPTRTGISSETVRATMRSLWSKKVLAPLGAAVFTGLLLPAVLDKAGRVVQDRQRERDLKAAMSESIVQPITATVTRAGLFAAGLIPTGGPGSLAYPTVLEEWLAASSKAGAQVTTYVEDGNATNNRLRAEWKPLFEAVTDYLRLSHNAENIAAGAAVERIRQRLEHHYPAQADGLNWLAIGGPRTSGWFDQYQELGYRLLAARDRLLADVRAARLAGFSRRLLEF